MRTTVLCTLLAASVALASEPLERGVYRRKIVTSDGVALATWRYVPDGGGRKRAPVLLLADVGLGREAFDLEGVGLARHLQDAGREVYVVEPRGHGRSDVPVGWRLSDVVRRDLPAVIAAIHSERSGPVDLVVHGYLGTLALAASTRELKGKIGRVAALSTPALVEVPNPRLEALLEQGGRFKAVAQTPQGRNELALLLGRHGQFKGRVLDELLSSLSDLGGPAASELLGWMRSGDLSLGQGDGLAARLAGYDRPTLLFLPIADNFAHPEFASPLRELATGAACQLRVLSRFELHGEDYTHLSMLHGESAPRDVWAPIAAFLEAR